MRFSSDRWFAWRAGAAVESGRMFPISFVNSKSNADDAQPYVQPVYPGQSAFRGSSSRRRHVAAVRVLAGRLAGN